MAAKLPLAARKLIRDGEPKAKATMEKFSKLLGAEFKYEIDWDALHAALPENNQYRDRIGDFFQGSILEAVYGHVDKLAKDPLGKEAFLESAHKRIIRSRIGDTDKSVHSNHGYNEVRFTDGVCEIIFPPGNFACNVQDCGSNLEKILYLRGLPLETRKGIRDGEAKAKVHLERLKKATGVEWKLDVNFDDLWKECPGDPKWQSYRNRIGALILDGYLEAVSKNVERICKDEMVKEALLEAAPKHVIHWKFGATDKSKFSAHNYSQCVPTDGALVITVPPANFPSNVGECGSTLEKLL